MRKHGGTPSRRDKQLTVAAISPPGVARGRFVGSHQSGLAGCKLPPLFKGGASSCSSQRQRQREPWGASPRPSAPTYLPIITVSQKRVPRIFIFALPRVRNYRSNLRTHSLLNNPGHTNPSHLIPRHGERHITTASNMLYIPWMVILSDLGIKKTIFQNFDFWSCQE